VTTHTINILRNTRNLRRDGHLSEKINLHRGHLSDDISGHLSDKFSIDPKNLCGQLSEVY
jgi:hypothetical protein